MHTTRSLSEEFQKGRSRICQLARELELGRIKEDQLTGSKCRIFTEKDRQVLAEYFRSLDPQTA